MKKIYLLSWMLACAVGCERVSEYAGALPELKLVLYSFIEPDSMVRVEARMTRHFSSLSAMRPRDVSGEIRVNGQVAGALRPSPGLLPDRYEAAVYPSPGDRVRVIARAEGLREASAEVTLPLEGATIRVDTTRVGPAAKLERVRYAIHVDDDGRERRYYRLVIETETEDVVDGVSFGGNVTYDFDPENDPLLVGGNSTWLHEDVVPNRFHVFTNEGFGARGYTLRVSAAARNSTRMEYEIDGQPVVQRNIVRQRVKLARIDEATYLHLKSIMLLEMDEGIMEPVQVYTNVRDGVGVIGYAWFSTVTFEMPEVRYAEQPIY
jgi:hypothetical protein